MNNFVVLHYEKSKGSSSGALSLHIMRGREDENGEWIANIPNNADPERTHLNRQLVDPDSKLNLDQRIKQRIDEALQGRTVKSNQVRSINVILSMSPDAAVRIVNEGKLDAWCAASLSWMKETHGEDNIVSAVLHMDEKTPHIHATLVPIVQGKSKQQKYDEGKKKEGDKPKRKYKKASEDTKRLCAADVMARTNLKSYQSTYAERMEDFGLKRGIEGSENRHVDINNWYNELVVKVADNEALLKEYEDKLDKVMSKYAKAMAALDGITKGAWDFFTGKSKRRADEAEKRAAETKATAEKQIKAIKAEANKVVKEANEKIEQARNIIDEGGKWLRENKADVENIKKYKETAEKAEAELNELKSKMSWREQMIEKFIRFGAVLRDQWNRLFKGESVQTDHMRVNGVQCPLDNPIQLQVDKDKRLMIYDKHWVTEKGFLYGIKKGDTKAFNQGSQAYNWIRHQMGGGGQSI